MSVNVKEIVATTFKGNATSATTASTATVAAKIGQNGSTGTPMTFNWSGKDGQPTWLWGALSSSETALYNPSNFVVSKAYSAANTTVTSASLKNMYGGTADMTAGTTALTTGTFYVMYE